MIHPSLSLSLSGTGVRAISFIINWFLHRYICICMYVWDLVHDRWFVGYDAISFSFFLLNTISSSSPHLPKNMSYSPLPPPLVLSYSINKFWWTNRTMKRMLNLSEHFISSLHHPRLAFQIAPNNLHIRSVTLKQRMLHIFSCLLLIIKPPSLQRHVGDRCIYPSDSH